MISINSNPLASRLATSLGELNRELQATANRVSSGKRVMTAADDPAAMGILSTLKSEQSSYTAVQKNLSAGMSLLDVASSSLQNQQGILGQMKELATQASSGTLNTDQRAALQETFTQLQQQLDDTVNRANLFGQNLTGTAAATVNIQSGITSTSTYTLQTAQSDAATLSVDTASIDLSDATAARAAMDAVDAAVSTVATNQSIIGAQQNGLKELAKNTSSVQNNLTESIGRIEDVDIAAETTKLQQLQTKMQLSTAMLGIINQFPSYALQLLR